jgi:YD repeat-containing protein
VAPSTSGCGSASSPYSTAYSYNGADQLLVLMHGNGMTGSFTYAPNSEQLSTLSYGKGTSTYFSLNYFCQNDPTNCPNGPATNDGQTQCIKDNVDNGRSATYAYDALGRLTGAWTAGSTNFAQWGPSESYDRYANRRSQTVTAGSGYQSSLSFADTGGA